VQAAAAVSIGRVLAEGARSSPTATVCGAGADVLLAAPPTHLQFGHSNPLVYAVLILAGVLAIGIVPPLLMDRLHKPGWKAAGGESAPQS